ncbi:hypothetical protein ST41_11120 [Prevotella pectinovora]|nr:hypothetical protein ST41_11120 [Prevotella pectinovora]
MIPGFTGSQTAKSQSLERIAILQEMGTTVATSWHGRAHNSAQNIHRSFFLFSLFLVIKKDCTVSQPGSPKLKQPIKEIDCTYKYV